MKYLILDTEYENSPRRLISIAYLICDSDNIKSEKYKLVKHNINIFQIDESGIAFDKHKITNKICQEDGENIEKILNMFSTDLDNIEAIVGHNLISADISTIRREAIGIGLWSEIRNKIKKKKLYDTIKEAKKNMDIDSYSLDKVYKELFKKDFVNHHDALEDCKATYQIFSELKNKNKIEEMEMNFPEDEVENQRYKICCHCNKNIKNYYKVKGLNHNGKYQKYNFKIFSVNDLEIGNNICSKCYDNIEVVKYFKGELVDIFNKNLNKNGYKYKAEFLDVKKTCFDYIETVKKEKKIYLNCPYEQRVLCKELGAKWDGRKKKWYINENLDREKFDRWIE